MQNSRFIINVPEEELQEIERICFQIEQAHWFYEDFVREENKALPSMSLKTFAARMFKHCPLLSQWAHNSETAYQNFLDYKFKVPVCGAIILNQQMDKVLLVKGWSSRSSWGFPRGKINKDEPEWLCAQREVIEETGFDILPYLVEKHRIEITQTDQKVLLYIITGIPEDTSFVPTTRKEISQISWHYIDDLPCGKDNNGKYGNDKEHRYYLIKPFVKRIKSWVNKHPEKLGKAAEIVNRLSAAGDDKDAGASGPTPLVGSGPISMKELFSVVNKVKSPVDNDKNPASPPPPSPPPPLLPQTAGGNDGGSNNANSYPMFQPPQAVVAGFMSPENGRASLLQTLMGVNYTPPPPPPSSAPMLSHFNNSVSPPPIVNGKTLSGFAFDTQAIMSAYSNAKTRS